MPAYLKFIISVLVVLVVLSELGMVAITDVHEAQAGYDLAVLRSTWDYPARREEFVAWAAAVPRLANPASVVSWNTDKRYLAELDGAGHLRRLAVERNPGQGDRHGQP